MNKLLIDLGIDDKLTKPAKTAKEFTKVKKVTNPKPDYNFMADLLMLPTTKKGFKYLLVMVDLWTDEFDIEPLKTKEPREVLAAFKKMFKRPYLNKPYASVQTDGGNEFKGEFKKYLFDESILKRTTMKGRHTQNSEVERLNRSLGTLFNGLMNKKERESGKQFRDWDQFVDLEAIKKDPKFKEGDVVRHALDVPRDALGNEHNCLQTFSHY
eukprot:m.35778 g.35778  ORF g.35778 m.35778 type:complete len:212 (-) comp10951_c0_seq2:863-1498(-)